MVYDPDLLPITTKRTIITDWHSSSVSIHFSFDTHARSFAIRFQFVLIWFTILFICEQ